MMMLNRPAKSKFVMVILANACLTFAIRYHRILLLSTGGQGSRDPAGPFQSRDCIIPDADYVQQGPLAHAG